MARIRSCNPEQWTDDDFVSCSPLARLLALGLRNFADDNGVFEWNPVKLKMRILPADNADVPALLAELVESRQVHHYTALGKDYGIIRNFTSYQRPKFPTFQHPFPSEELPNGYETHKAYSPKPTEALPKDTGKRAAVVEESSSRVEKQSPVQAQQSPPAPARVEPPVSPRCAELSALAEKSRVVLSAKARMHLRQWADEGLTDQQLADAIAIARERKPNPLEPIPIAYLVPIVEDVRAGRAKPAQPRGKAAIAGAKRRIAEREREEQAEAAAPRDGLAFEDTGTWERIRDDPDVIVTMGNEKGISSKPGENFDDFTARVLAVWWPDLEWAAEVDSAMVERVAQARAKGVAVDQKRTVVVETSEGRRYEHSVS